MRLRTRLGAPLAILAGVAVGLAFALVLRAERRLGAEPSSVLNAVSDSIGHRVEAERVDISYWPPGVVATGVNVADESPLGPGSLLRADELELRASPWALLRGRVVVDEVRLLRPAVRLVRGDDGRWNAERWRRPARPRAERSALRGPAVEVEIDTVRVRGGRIRYGDRALAGTAELEVEDVNLLARRAAEIRIDFNASALGGGPESFAGGVRIPPLGPGGLVAIALRGTALEAARVPELLSFFRIPLPIALELGGRLDLVVEGGVTPVWPAAGGRLRLEIDGRETAISAARGWLAKAIGTPARLDFELDRTSGAWSLERASLETKGIRLNARVDALEEEPGEARADGGQPPLRFAAESVRAEDLAAWFPVLAVLGASGAVRMEGRLEPQGDGVAADLGIRGGPLRLRAGGQAIATARASLRVRAAPRSLRGHAGLTDVAIDGFSTAEVQIEVDGVPPGPIHLAASALSPGRDGARLDGLSFAGTVDEGRIDLPWIDVAGLGGSLSGRASVLRSDAGSLVSFEPLWQGIDASALLRLLGVEERVSGVLSGRATIFAQGEEGSSLVANVGGEYEIHLAEGWLEGINPGRALVQALGRLPGLRGPIEDRVREQAPELLSPSAEVESVYARGTIARGEIDVDSVSLATRLYQADLAGHATFAGQVELSGRLAASPEAGRALLPNVAWLGLDRPSARDLLVPVAVRGRLPSLTVLVEPRGGRGGEDRPGLIERWLGGAR